jgi:hypothetical protein
VRFAETTLPSMLVDVPRALSTAALKLQAGKFFAIIGIASFGVDSHAALSCCARIAVFWDVIASNA